MNENIEEILKKRAESLSKLEEAEEQDEKIKVICFALGDEWYAIQLDKIMEILNNYKITTIPCTPEQIKGVINLRGEIISITDLKTILDMGQTEITSDTNVIIINVEGITTGLLVDFISDIADIPKDSIEPPLLTIEKSKAEYLYGEIMIDNKMHALINLDKLTSSRDMRFSEERA